MLGETKESRNTLVQNTVFIYMMRIASYIFPLITTPYLTRVLMEDNYGLYTWANAVMNYARLIVTFGFVNYGVEVIARCKDDKKKIGASVFQIISFQLIFTILTGAVLVVIGFFVGKFRANALLLLLSYLPVITTALNIDFVFQGMEKMKYITIRVVITKAIFLVLVFMFVHSPEQYFIVPVLTAVGEGISDVMMWTSLVHTCHIHLIPNTLKKGIKLLREASWYFLSRVSGAVYSSGNLVLLGIFCEDKMVAQFSVAYTIVAIAQNLITPLADSTYPHLVKNQNYGLVKKIIFLFEPIIIAGSAVVFFIAPAVVKFVFGSQYELAAEIFKMMIPIVIVTLPGCMFGFPVLSALGLHKEANLPILNVAVFHIVGSLILISIRNFNVYSVAILTVISECLVVVQRAYFVMRELKKRRAQV
ncbi:MAG: oligosaccharide flippase family protein [Blautia sp.]|nr:oligosaccharide flippase family protein [Blautia sp.]